MHKHRLFLFSSFIFTTALAHARAEEYSPQLFTRHEAIEYALSHNLNLAAARRTIIVQQGEFHASFRSSKQASPYE